VDVGWCLLFCFVSVFLVSWFCFCFLEVVFLVDFWCLTGVFGGFVGYLHVIMETKGGKKSKKSSIQYESPLGYVIEDVRPHGGSEKFRTAAYSNVSARFGFGLIEGKGAFGVCFGACRWLIVWFGVVWICSACGSHPDICLGINGKHIE
jgi:hypothetical protein